MPAPQCPEALDIDTGVWFEFGAEPEFREDADIAGVEGHQHGHGGPAGRQGQGRQAAANAAAAELGEMVFQCIKIRLKLGQLSSSNC